MNISTKQTHRHKEQTCGCPSGAGDGGGLGVWDEQMYIIIYKMDKQQSPTV